MLLHFNLSRHCRKFLILIFLIFTFPSLILDAQTITLGSGTSTTGTSSASPINTNFKSLHCQVVYTKAEINAAGITTASLLTKFGFYIATAPALALPNFTIKMKHTTAIDVSADDPGPFTTVYNTSSYSPTAGGYDLLTLSTPFAWNGTDNILVDVCFDPVATFSSTGTVRYYSKTNGFRYIRSDASSQCGVSTVFTTSTKPQCEMTFSVVACSGTPSPGNTLSSANPVCSGANFTLSTQFFTGGTGVTYQWQSSPDGTTWSNISGATTPNYTTSQTSASYYRCIVTCSASGLTGTSNPLLIAMNGFTNCYCAAGAAFNCAGGDEFIMNTTFNTINNSSSCGATYSNYKAISTNVNLGSTYLFSTSIKNFFTGDTAYVWFDWNQNASFFDAGEQYVLTHGVADSIYSANIMIPTSALLGSTVMRVRVSEAGTFGPCGNSAYGEVEDYLVNVLPAPNCSGTPVSGTTQSTATTICSGGLFTLSLSGTGIATGFTYQWQSSADGTVYTNIAGATSSTYTASITTSTYFRCVVTCSFSGLFSNSGGLLISVSPEPLGNTFSNPIILSSLPVSTTGNNLCSNCWTSTYTGSNAQSSADVFYKYTAVCDGSLTVSTCGSILDTYVHLLDNTGNQIAFNDDNGTSCTGTNASLTYNSIVGGQDYYIVVEGAGANTGNYSLSVSQLNNSYTWYADADGDTYGNAGLPTTTCTNVIPSGYSTDNTDCNDALASVHPGALEICNSIDDNCDGSSDEGLSTYTYYADDDFDGYGDISSTTSSCSVTPPSGFVVNNSDCNDNNSAIYPGATETCNAIDDDCDASIDEGAATATITPAGPTTFCNGSSVTLNANTGVGYTYQWLKNAHNITGATTSSYLSNKPGNYQVKVTVPGGCLATSAITTITVNPKPNATITYPNGLDMCGTTVVLHANGGGVSGTYQWLRGASAISGATAINYTPTMTGNYKVSVTNSFGCNKTSPPVSVIKTCREQFYEADNSSLTIYPNPAKDEFIIKLQSDKFSNNEAMVNIFNMLGQIVYTSSFIIEDGFGTSTIHLENDIAEGIYQVKINVETNAYSSQIMISK